MQKRSWFDSASEHQIQDVDGKQSGVKQNNGFFGINGQIHQYAKQNQKRSSGSGQIFFNISRLAQMKISISRSGKSDC